MHFLAANFGTMKFMTVLVCFDVFKILLFSSLSYGKVHLISVSVFCICCMNWNFKLQILVEECGVVVGLSGL